MKQFTKRKPAIVPAIAKSPSRIVPVPFAFQDTVHAGAECASLWILKGRYKGIGLFDYYRQHKLKVPLLEDEAFIRAFEAGFIGRLEQYLLSPKYAYKHSA